MSVKSEPIDVEPEPGGSEGGGGGGDDRDLFLSASSSGNNSCSSSRRSSSVTATGGYDMTSSQPLNLTSHPVNFLQTEQQQQQQQQQRQPMDMVVDPLNDDVIFLPPRSNNNNSNSNNNNQFRGQGHGQGHHGQGHGGGGGGRSTRTRRTENAVTQYATYTISHREEELNSKSLPKKYRCRFCVYKTSYKSDLNRHLRKHGLAPQHCPLCNMPFKTSGNLENHVRQAHGDVAAAMGILPGALPGALCLDGGGGGGGVVVPGALSGGALCLEGGGGVGGVGGGVVVNSGNNSSSKAGGAAAAAVVVGLAARGNSTATLGNPLATARGDNPIATVSNPRSRMTESSPMASGGKRMASGGNLMATLSHPRASESNILTIDGSSTRGGVVTPFSSSTSSTLRDVTPDVGPRPPRLAPGLPPRQEFPALSRAVLSPVTLACHLCPFLCSDSAVLARHLLTHPPEGDTNTTTTTSTTTVATSSPSSRSPDKPDVVVVDSRCQSKSERNPLLARVLAAPEDEEHDVEFSSPSHSSSSITKALRSSGSPGTRLGCHYCGVIVSSIDELQLHRRSCVNPEEVQNASSSSSNNTGERDGAQRPPLQSNRCQNRTTGVRPLVERVETTQKHSGLPRQETIEKLRRALADQLDANFTSNPRSGQDRAFSRSAARKQHPGAAFPLVTVPAAVKDEDAGSQKAELSRGSGSESPFLPYRGWNVSINDVQVLVRGESSPEPILITRNETEENQGACERTRNKTSAGWTSSTTTSSHTNGGRSSVGQKQNNGLPKPSMQSIPKVEDECVTRRRKTTSNVPSSRTTYSSLSDCPTEPKKAKTTQLNNKISQLDFFSEENHSEHTQISESTVNRGAIVIKEEPDSPEASVYIDHVDPGAAHDTCDVTDPGQTRSGSPASRSRLRAGSSDVAQSCVLCQQQFPSRAHLLRHLQRVHGMVLNSSDTQFSHVASDFEDRDFREQSSDSPRHGARPRSTDFSEREKVRSEANAHRGPPLSRSSWQRARAVEPPRASSTTSATTTHTRTEPFVNLNRCQERSYAERSYAGAFTAGFSDTRVTPQPPVSARHATLVSDYDDTRVTSQPAISGRHAKLVSDYDDTRVTPQPPASGRYAKLVSDFDEFAASPYACALCFFRTARLGELGSHVRSHLTGGSSDPVPETARFAPTEPFAVERGTSPCVLLVRSSAASSSLGSPRPASHCLDSPRPASHPLGSQRPDSHRLDSPRPASHLLGSPGPESHPLGSLIPASHPAPVTIETSEPSIAPLTVEVSESSIVSEPSLAPATLETSESPIAPVTAEVSDSPIAPVTIEVSDSPIAPVTFEPFDSPIAPVTQEAFESSIAPETLEASASSIAPVTLETSEPPISPVSSERPKASLTLETTESSIAPEIHKASESSIAPETLEASESPIAPVIQEASAYSIAPVHIEASESHIDPVSVTIEAVESPIAPVIIEAAAVMSTAHETLGASATLVSPTISDASEKPARLHVGRPFQHGQGPAPSSQSHSPHKTDFSETIEASECFDRSLSLPEEPSFSAGLALSDDNFVNDSFVRDEESRDSFQNTNGLTSENPRSSGERCNGLDLSPSQDMEAERDSRCGRLGQEPAPALDLDRSQMCSKLSSEVKLSSSSMSTRPEASDGQPCGHSKSQELSPSHDAGNGELGLKLPSDTNQGGDGTPPSQPFPPPPPKPYQSSRKLSVKEGVTSCRSLDTTQTTHTVSKQRLRQIQAGKNGDATRSPLSKPRPTPKSSSRPNSRPTPKPRPMPKSRSRSWSRSMSRAVREKSRCAQCGKTFGVEALLARHVRFVHLAVTSVGS